MRSSLLGLSLCSAFSALLGVSGCEGKAIDLPMPPTGKPFHYPLDEQLRLHHVQVRGTHNSYHVDTHDGSVEPWQYTHAPLYEQLDRQGIRQIELDVFLDDREGLRVVHVPYVDTGTRCHLFSECLAELRRFSDAFPGHFPLYIQIEPKADIPSDDIESFVQRLEAEILTAFPRPRLLTPDEVQGNAATLSAALKTHGWPQLAKLRGRVMFAFDTTGPIRTAYTHNKQDLHGRLLFVDSAPDDPFGAVSVLNDPTSDATAIGRAVKANFLVRTRADSDTTEARSGDTSRGKAALQSGAHFISTDFPDLVPGFSYRFTVPDGMPARCNPGTAPTGCTPLALEDPAFVGSYSPPGN